MSKIQAISLRSQWLGEKLRAAREKSGYLMKDAAEHIQADQTTLGRFERGTHKIRRAYVKELIDFYGISDTRERDYLVKLADDAWRKDWWDGDASDLETGFLDFTWLEARASHIRTFSPLLIHGLLQTREYARAVTVNALGKDTPKETVARMVELRMIRQRILHKEHPTQLSVILEEPALRRAVGGPKVLHNQLIHLLELGSRPHISIRVLSSACTEWDAGHTGPFTNFSMPDPYPEVSYVENLAGQTFLEEAAKVERFQRTYDGLDRTALNANESTKLIKEFAKDLE